MKYCLALDLVNDSKLIKEYDKYHKSVWPEVLKSIKKSGINKMEIYRVKNRLFMIIETRLDFSFENKRKIDKKNKKVLKWEKIMSKYQQKIPNSKPDEKWSLMKKIFKYET